MGRGANGPLPICFVGLIFVDPENLAILSDCFTAFQDFQNLQDI
jgi:hypothetical protein